MNDTGKSDGSIVPKKRPNEGGRPPEEAVEGRDPTQGNSHQQTRFRTQNRADLQNAMERVRAVAQSDKGCRFTTLWHHVYNPARLREAYFNLERTAAAGVDGVTWQAYGERLGENLADLSTRLQRGAYRARPVRRSYIPKRDGRPRPIGVTVLEDKIVQRATTEVLNAVYEADFLGFSYGFRPERSQHDALDALAVGLTRKKVNWVLDADIRGFFDAIDHEWMVKFVEHRIADKRVIRHVQKWLKAGVMEDGQIHTAEEGTPQGGSISPLLANVYLHYVFDLWADQWRRRHGRGDVIIVRFADDFIVGFEHQTDAQAFRKALEERLTQFGLELHPTKTRQIEFGRYAADRRQRRGQGKPETFDFLGFTHICGRKRNGKYLVHRQTQRQRMRAKLGELRVELRRRMHWPVPEVGRWLASVLRGHYRYYGVPHNIRALGTMRYTLVDTWYRTLRRRSQKTRLTWDRMTRLAARWLPEPRILQPYPSERLARWTRGRSPVR